MNLDEFNDGVMKELRHALCCAEDCALTIRDLLDGPDEKTPPAVTEPLARVVLGRVRRTQELAISELSALEREIESARKAEEERRAAEAPAEEEVRF